MNWISFLRQYGPISQNDNMYDETILRSAHRAKVDAILFEHPAQQPVLDCFRKPTAVDPYSVILTGTAGDGKTHLCRQVWTLFGGSPDDWASDNPYLSLTFHYPKDRLNWPNRKDPALYRNVTIHLFVISVDGRLNKVYLGIPQKRNSYNGYAPACLIPILMRYFLLQPMMGNLLNHGGDYRIQNM